jgi:TAT (twin-arginine translocation) pathway signal sequence
MSKRRNFPDSNRRNFLKGAGLVSAAALTPLAANAQVSALKQKPKASVPGPTQIAVETVPPSKDPVNQTSRRFHGRCAQDAQFRLSGDELRFGVPRHP